MRKGSNGKGIDDILGGIFAVAGTGGHDHVPANLAGPASLDGGAGNDTLNGGSGNDVYLVDSINDVVEEGFAGGKDIILAGQKSGHAWALDAKTGKLVYGESLISHVDVTGNVSGIITPGKKADICETEVLTPLPATSRAGGATPRRRRGASRTRPRPASCRRTW